MIDSVCEARVGVELRQIDCFLAVATDLHFGKAAKRLSLAQSSVSEAIHSLEKEVGGQAGGFSLPLLARNSASE
jgi:hypothetical protein